MYNTTQANLYNMNMQISILGAKIHNIFRFVSDTATGSIYVKRILILGPSCPPEEEKKIPNEKVFKTISLLSKHMLQCTNNFGKDNVNTPFSVFSYKLCSKSWEKTTLFLFFLMLIFCGHSKLVFNIEFWSEKKIHKKCLDRDQPSKK